MRTAIRKCLLTFDKGVAIGPQIEELLQPHHLPSLPFVLSGVVLFLLARCGCSVLHLLIYCCSSTQFAAHAALASIRSKPGSGGQFGVPTGSAFEWLTCPHYSAEILIYGSFILVSGGKNKTLWYGYSPHSSNTST